MGISRDLDYKPNSVVRPITEGIARRVVSKPGGGKKPPGGGGGGAPDPYAAFLVLDMPFTNAIGIADRTARHTATANGGAAVGAAPGGGHALVLDGVDDYLEISHSTDFDFGSGPLSVTLEVYVDAGAAAQDKTCIYCGLAAVGATAHINWEIARYGASLAGRFQSLAAISGSSYTARSVPGVSTGAWHTVKMYRSANVIRQKLDGAADGVSLDMGSPGIINANVGVLRIGRFSNAAPQYMNGYIRNLKIYKGSDAGA